MAKLGGKSPQSLNHNSIKKINKVRDRKMKVKHTYLVQFDGKPVEGQVKVAIRVRDKNKDTGGCYFIS